MNSLAGTNFFWTASHAIGAHTAASRSHTPNYANAQNRENGATPAIDDECIGTTLRQNTLAPAAAHRPSLPAANLPQIIESNQTVNEHVKQSDQPIASNVSAKPPPCHDCGGSIM